MGLTKCSTEFCENVLGKANKSGYCSTHRNDPPDRKIKRAHLNNRKRLGYTQEEYDLLLEELDDKIFEYGKKECAIQDCKKTLNKANRTGFCEAHMRHAPSIKAYKNSWINNKRSGITQEEYDNLLAQQGGGCASCKTNDPGGMGRFHVDHDHNCCPKNSCGKCIRGLLCTTCNLALGLLQDDPIRILALLEYIEKSGLC